MVLTHMMLKTSVADKQLLLHYYSRDIRMYIPTLPGGKSEYLLLYQTFLQLDEFFLPYNQFGLQNKAKMIKI